MHSEPTDPAPIGNYPTLSQILREESTAKLHGFSSGGRLRVVSFQGTRRKGYGEHPYVYNALRIAEDDAIAGGRAYGEVYGPIEPHYLTGAYPPKDRRFDCWAYQRSFDIYFEDNLFHFTSKYMVQRKVSQAIIDQVNERHRVFGPLHNASVRWTEDDIVFESSYSNGGVTTQAVEVPPHIKKDVWYFDRTKHESAQTFEALIQKLDDTLSE